MFYSVYIVPREENSFDMVERSIFFNGSVLISPQHNQPLLNIIRDDDIALEETENITLQLLVQSDCRVDLLPFNFTTIAVRDDDGMIVCNNYI